MLKKTPNKKNRYNLCLLYRIFLQGNPIIRAICTANNAIFAEPQFRWNLIETDPDDIKFADLAISQNAYCVVTYDKHFDIFNQIGFPTLKVVKPAEFKKILDSKG